MKYLATIAEKEFPEILEQKSVVTETFIRSYLADGSFVEVRYPKEDKYSIHWQRKIDSLKINTAPHHPEVSTFPSHIYKCGKIKPDEITDINFPAEENLRRFLKFAKELIQNKF